MGEKTKKGRQSLVFIILLIVYFIIQGCCMLITSDDIPWAFIPSLKDFFESGNPNGRYLTNFLTYLSCHYIPFRDVYYILTMSGFAILTAKLLHSGRSFQWLHWFFVVLIFFFAPPYFYAHVFNWTSGFPNYVFPLIFLFGYFIYCEPIYDKKLPKGGAAPAVLSLIAGFLGSLCVEHITIYNILFGIFIIIFSLAVLKKVRLANISFLLGAVIGTVLMFTANNYSQIMTGEDEMGFRSFEFEFSDIMTKVYTEIIPCFACSYFYIHAAIAVSVIILYVFKFRNSEQKPKYAKLCLPLIILYFVYSFLSFNGQELVITSAAYRERAFEAAFVFVYIISLLYMVYHILSGSDRIKAILYLLSAVMTIAPFVVINPITRRCFFVCFIFWCLFALRLLGSAISVLRISEHSIFRVSAIAATCGILGFLSFVDISNKYVDVLRVNYVKEQLETDQRHINFILLPYSGYCFETAGDLETDFDVIEIDGRRYRYDELYYMYNDIDLSVRDRVRVNIGMYDYNMAKES